LLPWFDPERALAFYRDILGLQLLFQALPNLASFDCVGMRLMLGPAEGAVAVASSILYSIEPDIHAAHLVL
jgi:catechol 2,3-dioxygenase-like lactoylglutathione lyase family enzyme